MAALSVLLAGPTVGSAEAAPAAGPGECPATMSSADATTGLVGEGLTVVSGSTPQPFRVEVLGVQPDGIGGGRDLVLIKVSDLLGGHVVDQGGGIWAGMSGSPVYVGGKLLGAISYGFTDTPSPIGGLTPASDMADLLDLSAKRARTADVETTDHVTLPRATRRAVGARAGVAVPSASLQRLPSPLAVSGLSGARLKRLQKDVATADLPLRVYASGRAPVPSSAPSLRPVPGGNFASVHSYGDVSFAAIGTTTYVCGDRALAFGHPDQFSGPVRYGANGADGALVVRDDVMGSFKMANVGGSFGTVDQDRLTGVRADLTKAPSSVPIKTTVTNVDTGRRRTGTTGVVDRALLAGLTPYALWANLDTTLDEIGDGRMSEGWTITGTRAGGKRFKVHRNNTWADQEDLTFWPAVGLADDVDALTENDEEHVTITSLTYDAKVSTTFRSLRLTKVELSTNRGKTWSTKKSFKARAGKKLWVRVTVKPYQGTRSTRTVTSLKVPKSAKGADVALTVIGGSTLADSSGSDDTACLLDDSCDQSEGPTLDATIRGIESTPRNDDVVVALQTGSDDPMDDTGKNDTTVLASGRVRQAEVVDGAKSVRVRVR